jgi:predicted RNA binding protein YcfA (HicA-like mRNA interferase family)
VKLPRDVSGRQVIDHLCRHWGYRQVSQVGSHVILITDTPIHQRLPIPLHSPLGIGIFKKILREVCAVKNVTQATLLQKL